MDAQDGSEGSCQECIHAYGPDPFQRVGDTGAAAHGVAMTIPSFAAAHTILNGRTALH